MTEPTIQQPICPTCNRPLPKLAPEVRAYLRENQRKRAAAKRAKKAAQQ